MTFNHTTNNVFVIRPLISSDIPIIVARFVEHHWPKSSLIFEHYLQEQQRGDRLVWIAEFHHQFAGYVTLVWQSTYPPFLEKQIPEIKDLNVLPSFRNQGVGTKLLTTAENEASHRSPIVGIGVGLYQDYGAAQKLYVKRGYVPDGQGITYHDQLVVPGSQVVVDDDLVLWMTKRAGML